MSSISAPTQRIKLTVQIVNHFCKSGEELEYRVYADFALDKILTAFASRSHCITDDFVVLYRDNLIPSLKYKCTFTELGIENNAKVSVYRKNISLSNEEVLDIKGLEIPSSYSLELRSLLNDETSSDVAFVVQGTHIRGHKCILTARCPKFRAMFQLHTFKEGQQNEIAIEGHDPKVFKTMLEYLYTDVIAVADCDFPFELLAIAEEYLLPRLKFICEKRLIKNMDLFNVASMLIHADMYNCELLKKFCMKFIKASLDVLLSIEQFEKDIATSPNLMIEILRLSCKRSKVHDV